MADVDRISAFYKGRHILITGGTGFMGKVFVEKLLRNVPDIGKIYLLIRIKKGKDPKDRLVEMFENPLFDTLKRDITVEKILKKIQIIGGDCSLEGLGLSDEHRQMIVKNVTMIYHCAATIKFDEPLKRAVELNTRGTREMITLALECKKLDVFGYISTAYCHLHESFLLEKPYDPPADPHKIIRSIEFLDDTETEIMTKRLLGHLPNTYAFTKALAEALVNEACAEHNLPAMIFRPSIVIPTLYDPIPGWTDNLNGPAGLMVGTGKGVIRTLYADQKSYGDFLPVDIAVNGLMVCTWNYLAFNDKEHNIINFVSSQEILVRWEEITSMGLSIIHSTYPINGILWYPGGQMTTHRWLYKLKALFYHWIPAFFIDLLLRILGQKPILMRVHDRISKGMDVLEYYANNQWDFDNKNALMIRAKLNKLETTKYKCDAEGVDIYKYFENCIIGARRYLLKQPDHLLPQARKIMKVMYVLDRVCKLLFFAGLFYFLNSIVMSVFFTPEQADTFYEPVKQFFGKSKIA